MDGGVHYLFFSFEETATATSGVWQVAFFSLSSVIVGLILCVSRKKACRGLVFFFRGMRNYWWLMMHVFSRDGKTWLMDLHLEGMLFAYDPKNSPTPQGSIVVYNSDDDSTKSNDCRGQSHCDKFLDLEKQASPSPKASMSEEERLLRSHPIKRKVPIPATPTQNIRYGAQFSTDKLEESEDLNAARIISEGLHEPEVTVMRVETHSTRVFSPFETEGYSNVIDTPEGSDSEFDEVKKFFSIYIYLLPRLK